MSLKSVVFLHFTSAIEIQNCVLRVAPWESFADVFAPTAFRCDFADELEAADVLVGINDLPLVEPEETGLLDGIKPAVDS